MPAEARVKPPGTQTGNAVRDSAMGLVPETLDSILRLNGRVWRESRVPPALLEILRLRNARTVNCVYCKSVRYDAARRDGLSEERAQLVADGYAQSALAPREKLAIALADAYLGFPAGVDPELAARLAREFAPDEIASMLVALMTFNFTSRTAVSLGGMPEGPLPITEVTVASSSD